IANQINRIVSGGYVLNIKADSAHGSDGPAVAGGCFGATGKSKNVIETIVIGGRLRPDLRHVAPPRIVRANESKLRGFSGLELGNDVGGNLAQNEPSLRGDYWQFAYDFVHIGPKRGKQAGVGGRLTSG